MLGSTPHTVVGSDGDQWVIAGVVFDEAGPESVRLIRLADFHAGRRAAALTLDIAQWCRFCDVHGIAPGVLTSGHISVVPPGVTEQELHGCGSMESLVFLPQEEAEQFRLGMRWMTGLAAAAALTVAAVAACIYMGT